VNEREALAVLGLEPGASPADIRSTYRRLVRLHHPDVAGAAATARAARLTQAYAILRTRSDEGTDAGGSPPGWTDAGRPAPAPGPRDPGFSAYENAVEAERDEGDTLIVHAPADETYAAVFDAAGRVGHIAYFDRHLGIIEAIVRFEGGPSCSLLITLQGRATGTEVFVTLESIEADPTPPLQPVVDALVDELTGSRPGEH
jgi:hypothetical protein